MDYTNPTPRYLEAAQGLVRGLFGLVIWELLVTARIEVGLLRSAIQWRWHMGVFLLARMSLFVLLLITAIGTYGLNIHTTQQCEAYVSIVQVAEAFAITASTGLLVLRVFALWNENRLVIASLSLASLGQLATCMLAINIMQWGDGSCWSIKTTSEVPYYLALKYIYALCFDALILLLALAKLTRLRTATSIHPFLRLLRRDGLIFFFAGFFAGASQVVVAIVGIEKLQEPYRREVIQDFAAFGTALRVIAATRLYANLADFPPSSARTSRATRGTGTTTNAGAFLTDPVSIFANITMPDPRDATQVSFGDVPLADRPKSHDTQATLELINLKTPTSPTMHHPDITISGPYRDTGDSSRTNNSDVV